MIKIAIAACGALTCCMAIWFIQRQKALDNATQAYLYAYPLVLMGITQKTMTHQGKNRFVHIKELPTPTFKDIVRPNVDTLYSFAWLDLSSGPIKLSVPDTHDRYYLMELMDAWTNVFASLGKRTTGTHAQDFIIVGPGYSGPLPEKAQVLHAPTQMVLILARTQTNGKNDYAFVHALQEGYKVTPLYDHEKEGSASVESAIGKSQAPVDQVAAMDVTRFYAFFKEMLQQNPPSPADAPIMAMLTKLDTTLLAAGKKRAFCKMAAHMKSLKHPNGWSVMLNIGTYGTDYLTRAMIAWLGIGANIPADAIYPTAFVDTEGTILTGKNRYVIHFNADELPPVKAFWSITLYNAESFLVQNSLGRYALGDRDALAFNSDGSLDIYIQHENPGRDKERNWLPAPEDDFNLTMRLYWPEQSVLNGTWTPPGIKKLL